MAVDIFKVGSVEMLVLLFLKDRDAHGYLLAQLIEDYSDGELTVKTASLYPILYRLSENGYITGREIFVERKMPNRFGRSARIRVVYHMEPSGFDRLKELLEEHKLFMKACDKVFARVESEDNAEEK